MDPIEDVIAAMRVKSALHARLEAKAPWGILFAPGPHARFGIVARGRCWMHADGLPQPIALRSGDCFIVRADARFILQDETASPLVSCEAIFAGRSSGTIAFGGDGAPTDIVSGRFAFDASAGEPLMSLLPPVVHIRVDHDRSRLLQATLHLIAAETTERALGADLVVARLADVLFVQALRAWCASDGRQASGWLAALADRHLGPTVRALHTDITRPWTVESLAAAAGLSRSAFASRFKGVVGDTPLGYLTRWRMYRAKDLLRQGNLGLLEIAARVGYESDAAFSRAFKRIEGMAPGAYRQRHNQPGPDDIL
ncbi:MAG TPA: AraC family transcriptional regulator [Betaproteobacteria bacterium]|nr:AraC family transcriptional regulator [Betaproteobacteria bacterium]